MDIFITVVAFAACFFVLIAVHEFGHFLAGWAGGIPARDMRICLLTFPQHVRLRDGDHWVSPLDLEPYIVIMRRHLTTMPRCYLYVSGGLLMESLFSVAATVALVESGWRTIGRVDVPFLVAFSTLLHYVTYFLVLDPLLSWRYGRASGDFSGLWTMARFPTAMLVLGLFAVQSLLLWYAKR